MESGRPFEVFVVDSAEVPHGEDDGLEQKILGDCAVVHTVRLHSEADFVPYLHRADAVILWHHIHFTRAVLAKMKRARIIVRNGVGFDNVDVAAAADAGVAVANVPDYGTEEVADHAIALMLGLLRQVKALDASVRSGSWDWKFAPNVRRLSTLVLGIVGCGRIGTAVAVRGKALGLRVQFYDPYVAVGYEKAINVARSSSLQALLEESDVVSLHAPLTEETRYLIDAAAIARMRPSAVLVNTARGGLIASDALLNALTRGTIAGAGIDVLDNEPDLATRFAELHNCIVTPHSAFYSQESIIEMRKKSAGIVRKALTENLYQNVVNGVNRSQTQARTGASTSPD